MVEAHANQLLAVVRKEDDAAEAARKAGNRQREKTFREKSEAAMAEYNEPIQRPRIRCVLCGPPAAPRPGGLCFAGSR